ncbi:MAG: hypothetical protein ACI9J3_003300 [Parvicellaceae bacterium]|jgi:hypothetical protein
MLNFRKKKAKQDKTPQKEYSFIWYKEMKTGNNTYYTKPFRTKVKAASHAEAKEKAQNFALGKMKLVVIDEKDFDKSSLAKIQRGFDRISQEMNDMFEEFNI